MSRPGGAVYASGWENRKTRLVQRSVTYLSEANGEFNNTGPDGREVRARAFV